MKIALTVWGKWVSPVFDSAQTILMAEIVNGAIENRTLFTFEAEYPTALAKQLKKKDVSVLICGAISEYPAKILENEDLRLIPFISGVAETVLQTLARGKPIVPLYLMPGCRIRELIRGKKGQGNGSPNDRCCRNRQKNL